MGGDYVRGLFNQFEELEAQMAKMESRYTEKLHKVEQRYEAMLADAREEIRYHKARADAAEKKIIELEEKVRKLENEISRLKSNQDKDSHNSSLPPSADRKPKAANEYNGRTKTGKKSGGQPGHKGTTRRMEQMKQALACIGVEPETEDVGDLKRDYRERLVIDLSFSVRAVMKRFHADQNGKYHIPAEYANEVVYGNGLKAFAAVLYGQGVQSLERITQLISMVTGKVVQVSQGSIQNWLCEFHKKAGSEIEKITGHLLNHACVHTDGTNVTQDGKQSYIRNVSIPQAVLYVPVDAKSHQALSAIPFLKQYTGTLIHDHETALYQYGLYHAECNVHLIRYLTKNSEDTKHRWSRHMISLLVEMNRYRKRLIAQSQTGIPKDTLNRMERRYDALLEEAEVERERCHSCPKWALKEEKALIKRLKKYKDNHLLFLHDFAVSFDNNLSERDLRKCKNRQKMSGGFRTGLGRAIFCSVMTITETCKRQGKDLLEAFSCIFAGKPLFA